MANEKEEKQDVVDPTITDPTGATQQNTPGMTGAAGANNVADPPLSQSQIAKHNMEEAGKKVYDVMNKKFVYNKKTSPLYTIMQQQYERDAERAAGAAYARAVANTGGYGSSYANLTADEARRRTMEGFDDQQMALYQAARDEFLSERQSATDWYSQARTMYADAQAADRDAATNTAISMWGTSSEEEIRAKLEAAGYDATTISDAIAKAKGGEVTDNEMDATLRQQEHDEAVSTGTELVAGMYTGLESEETIRTKLAEAGYSDAVINDIIDKQADEYYADLARQNGIDEQTYERDYNDATELAINEYNRGTSLDEIRNQLNALGLNSVAIDAVMRKIKERKEEDDYKAASEFAAENWTNADSEATVREGLKKAGYSDAMIDKVITEQKQRYWANIEADNGMRKEEYEQQKYEAGQAAQNLVGKTKDDGTVYTMADIRAELEAKYGRGVVEPVMEALMKAEAAKVIESEWKSVEDTERLLNTLKAQGYSASVLMPLLREREDLYYADLARANGITEQTYQRDLNTGREIAAEMYGTEKDLEKIRDALVKAGLNDVAIEAVIREYTEKKDADDAKAASDNAALWYSQGSSPEEIRAKLTEQGYRPSVVDELVSYYTDRQAQDEARAEEAAEKEATNYVAGHFTSLDDEADVRSYLQSQFNEDGSRKYSDAMIEKVMTARKEQYWSNLASTRGIREEEYKGQVSEATTLANSLIGRTKEDGTAYTMAEIRAELSKNYDYTVVEPIMEKIMETEAAKYVAANWKDSSSEAQIRADMLANGYSASAIDAALRNKKLQYWDDLAADNGIEEQELINQRQDAAKIAQNLVGQNYSMAQIYVDLLKDYDESVVGPIMEKIMETEAAKYVAANWKDSSSEADIRTWMLGNGYSASAIDTALRNKKLQYWDDIRSANGIRVEEYNTQVYEAGQIARNLVGKTKDDGTVYTMADIRADLLKDYDESVVGRIMDSIMETEAAKYVAANWKGIATEDKLRDSMLASGYSEAAVDAALFNHKNTVLAKGEQDKAFRDQQYNYAATDAEKYLADGMTPDEIRDKLDDSYDAGVVEEIMGGIQQGQKDRVNDATQLLTEAFSTVGFAEASMSDYLKNQGYTPEEINAAIGNVKNTMKAGLDDMEKNVVGISDAATYKETLDAYLRNGTIDQAEYDKRIAANSAKIMESVNKGLEDLEETDYQALGYSQSEWDAMEDDEKKQAIFDSVGQMVENGIVKHGDFFQMLYHDLEEEFSTKEYRNGNASEKFDTAVGSATIIQDLYENGYLKKPAYKKLVGDKIWPEIENDEEIRKMMNIVENYYDKYEGDEEKLSTAYESYYATLPDRYQTYNKYTEEERKVMMKLAILMFEGKQSGGENNNEEEPYTAGSSAGTATFLPIGGAGASASATTFGPG